MIRPVNGLMDIEFAAQFLQLAHAAQGGDQAAVRRAIRVFERAVDRIAKMSAEGYPPYNIEQLGDNRLRITLAVAGFGERDLQIQVENSQLTIRGRQEDTGERVYLHRGIAARQFQRSFVLAEGIEVVGAELDNGLLHVDLVRPEQESRVKTIEIKAAPRSGRPVETRSRARALFLCPLSTPLETEFGKIGKRLGSSSTSGWCID